MNRRYFLSALAASVATATFDPERLLFVPGRKLISIPKPRITGIDLAAEAVSYAIYAGNELIGMRLIETISREQAIAR